MIKLACFGKEVRIILRTKRGRWAATTALAIVISLAVTLLLSDFAPVVRAERLELDFTGGTIAPGYRFSASKTLTGSKTVTANAGERIKKLELVNVTSGDRQEITAAKGLMTYTFSKTFAGSPVPVKSVKNQTEASYYAWYRYSVSTGDPEWHADFDTIDNSYAVYTNHRTCGSGSDPDYPSLHDIPGCTDSTLTLSGPRTAPFYTADNTWVDTQYINHDDRSGTQKLIEEEEISGPEGISGYPNSATFSNMTVDVTPDFNTVIVRHTGNFTYKSPFAKQLALPGAAVMVYFGRFQVDITSNTYLYPYVLEAEYEPASGPSPSVTPTPSPSPTPKPKIDGDFDIAPSAITWRDPFALEPKPFTIPAGCAYVSHKYRITVGDWDEYTSDVTNRTASTSFTYSTYPRNLSVGANYISIKITATCNGETIDTGYIHEKPLTISQGNNNPPVFKLGWFKKGEQYLTRDKRKDYLVIGQTYDLAIVQEPDASPPLPSDPENDTPITFTWHFSQGDNPIAQDLAERYGNDAVGEKFTRIKIPDDRSYIGSNKLIVSGEDRLKAKTNEEWNTPIIGPEPIAACRGANGKDPEVKSRRPFSISAFDTSDSWSPLDRNIVETKWENLQPYYVNDGDTPIYVTLKLTVEDSAGLWSDPTDCRLKVNPDLPPVGKLKVQPIGIRNQAIINLNQSYSIDGDQIVSASYRYKYDSNNNGFSDDSWQNITSGTSLEQFTFTADKVGKYLFDVTACEDYGKCSVRTEPDEAGRIFDVVNDYPEVSFEMEGKNQQPDVERTQSFSANEMLGWNLYETNTNNPITDKWKWHVVGDKLVSRNGKDFGEQRTVMYYDSDYMDGDGVKITGPDYGYGNNTGLSPWRALVQPQGGGRELVFKDPRGNQLYEYFDDSDYNKWAQWKFTSNQKYIYFKYYDNNNKMNVNFIDKSKVMAGDANYYTKKLTLTGTKETTCQDQTGHTVYSERNGDTWVVDQTSAPYACTTPYSISLNDALGAYWLADETIYAAGSITYSNMGTKLVHYDYQAPWDEPVYDSDGYITGYIHHDAVPAHDQVVGTITSSKTGFFSFDAVTGEFIAFQESNGYFADYNSYLFQREDSIFIFRDDLIVTNVNFNGQKPSPVRYNRNFNVVYSNPDPLGPACTATEGRVFSAGDYGFVGYADCESHWVDGTSRDNIGHVWAYRLDRNFHLVWRQPTLHADASDDAYQGSRMEYHAWQALIQMDANPKGNYVAVPSYGYYYTGNGGNTHKSAIQYFRLSDGAGLDSSVVGHYDWNGNKSGVYNADGTDLNQRPQYKSSYWNWSYYDEGFHAKYLGDGIYLGEKRLTDPGNSREDYRGVYLIYGPYNLNYVHDPFVLGQFVSSDQQADIEIKGTIQMKDPSFDSRLTGVSFRMQDPMNRYALELDGANLYISRYAGGSRQVLGTQPYSFMAGTDYSFRIVAAGSRIQVWFNSVPVFDVTDTAFASGKYGYFSDKSYVSFGKLSVKMVIPGETDWLTQYAIWEDGAARAEVRYKNIIFTDPENDPMAGGYQWTYTHTPKFLNNQGVSNLNGRTFTDAQLYFDKVGVYQVTLQARDDPHPWYLWPSMVFDSYRKASNPFSRTMIVHRRPVAQFTLSKNADGSVAWNDTSYDPDRFDPSVPKCDSPENGHDYCANRGVFERKYWYTSPSGSYVEQKLVTPSEPGEYEVGLMVKDEYGAWSKPYIQTIAGCDPLAGGCPAANPPPTVTLDYPNGTKDAPNLITTTQPTVQWRQFDTPGTVFKGYHVKIEQACGSDCLSLVYETGEAQQNTTLQSVSWTVPASVLQPGGKYRFTVRAADEQMQWSDWSNEGWVLVNAPPRVTITNPNGADKDHPTLITGDKRPVISWIQGDNEYAYFKQFTLEVRRADGTLVYNSNNRSQETTSASNSFRIDQDLPTNEPLQVSMRVSDHAGQWSNVSNTVWLKINYIPQAVMTYPTGTYDNPTMGSPTPLITWTQTDPDPHTVFTKYRLLIRNEAATVSYLDTTVLTNTTASAASFQVITPLPAGEKVRVTVMVWDDNGASSDWAPETWMLTNRPPVADFDWTPKPVWEGDTVMLHNLSSDPDGNELTYRWEIRAPDGSLFSSTDVEPDRVFLLPGDYTLKLTVSDGYEQAEAVHVIRADPLTILPEVEHTPEWLKNHERKGHNTTVRPKDFYSGEIFVVICLSAPAPVDEVEAWIDTTGKDGKPLAFSTKLEPEANSSTNFAGELFDEKLLSLTEGLPEGVEQVHFHIRYSNGIVKEDSVPVNIIGSVYDYFGVHRVQ